MALNEEEKQRLVESVYREVDRELTEHAPTRNAFSRPTGYMDMRYDDLDDEESTVVEIGQNLEEALLLFEEEEGKKLRQRKFNAIRTQLDAVWVTLGKAETKLGAAQFDADDANFRLIQKILQQLIQKVKGLMKQVESARDKIQ